MGQWVEMHSKVGVLEQIQSTQEDQFMKGLVKVAATDAMVVKIVGGVGVISILDARRCHDD